MGSAAFSGKMTAMKSSYAFEEPAPSGPDAFRLHENGERREGPHLRGDIERERTLREAIYGRLHVE